MVQRQGGANILASASVQSHSEWSQHKALGFLTSLDAGYLGADPLNIS